jgi:hypothetical protein
MRSIAEASLDTDGREASKRFFLKKEAKPFANLACALRQGARQADKSFLVLFFKKELLAFRLLALARSKHFARRSSGQSA